MVDIDNMYEKLYHYNNVIIVINEVENKLLEFNKVLIRKFLLASQLNMHQICAHDNNNDNLSGSIWYSRISNACM